MAEPAALVYVDRVCISQSQHLISADLGLSKKQRGLALTVFAIAYGLFEIAGGWLGLDPVTPLTASEEMSEDQNEFPTSRIPAPET